MNKRVNLTNKKVLVTGGAGFIGSNLCEKLLKLGNQVVCLDNFATGKRNHIEAFIQHPEFTFIEGDIRNMEDCKKAVAGIEYVFHQAALGSVPRSINDPATSTQVNISGFVNMLVASRDARIKRFIYAASSSTYGDHPGLPKVEDKIGKPLSPYAITKYVNELYASNFAEIYGMEVIGLRYFNVFGKRQDPDGAYAAVIPKFIKQLIQKEQVIINGDGGHSRDFTYIDNVIQANLLSATVKDKNAINTVYNVAYGENTTLNTLFQLLKEFLSEFDASIKSAVAANGLERKGDVKHSLASVDKAKKLLGYHPQYDIKEGLKEAIEWYYNYFTHNK